MRNKAARATRGDKTHEKEQTVAGIKKSGEAEHERYAFKDCNLNEIYEGE